MLNGICKKWKESFEFFNFGFFKQFFNNSWNKAVESILFFIKKFWYFPLSYIFLSFILVFILRAVEVQNYSLPIIIFVPGVIFFIFLFPVLIFASLFYIFLPFFITRSVYASRIDDYVKLFISKFFGLAIVIPFLFGILWYVFAVFFRLIPLLLPFFMLFSVFLYLVKYYATFLFFDSSGNRAIHSCVIALKVFFYNFPAFLFLMLSLVLLNIISGFFILFIVLLVFLFLKVNIILFMVIPFIFGVIFLHYFYFFNLSFIYNFYQITKSKNNDLLTDL